MRLIETGSATHYAASQVEAAPISIKNIPIVDLQAPRSSIVAAIAAASESSGFFYIANHGVEPQIIAQLFEQAQAFFKLPIEKKQALHVSKSPINRGYVPLLEEIVDCFAAPDLHEAFDLGWKASANDSASLQPLQGANVYPDAADLPLFEQCCDRYYLALYQLGRRLFQLFALALDLPEQFFEAKIVQPLAQLRLLHYPPQPDLVDDRQVGTGAHTDYECFTILAQDDAAGLQILNADGSWTAIPPISGTFVVNIGDLLMRWSNGRFQSRVHRAINQSGRDRYAIPFFFAPASWVEIKPLDTCISQAAPVRYEPVVVSDYLTSRYDATFAYRQQPVS